MKTKWLLSAVCSLLAIYLSIPNPIFAQKYRTEPQHVGPVHILFDNPDADPSVYPDSTSNYLYVKTVRESTVHCVDDPELIGRILGNGDIDRLYREAPGRLSRKIDRSSNLALDSEPLLDKLDNVGPNHRSLVNYYDKQAPTTFNSACVALGITDQLECAKKLNCTLPDADGKERINLLCIANPYQLLTSRETQLKNQKERAEEIISCMNDPAPPNVHCDNIYYTGLTRNSPNSYNVAQKVPDTLEEFNSLSTKEKMEVMSLQPNLATQKAWLVFTNSLNLNYEPPTPFHWFYYRLLRLIYDDNDGDPSTNRPRHIQIIPIYLPGLIGSVRQTQNEFQLLNRLEEAQESINRIETTIPDNSNQSNIITVISPLDNPAHYLIIDRINKSGKSCANVDNPPTQFYGGTFDTRSPASAIYNWIFHLPSNNDDLEEAVEGQPMFVTSAWLVAPHELYEIEQYFGLDKNAVPRRFIAANLQSSLDKVDIPQRIDEDESAHAETPYAERTYTETILEACEEDEIDNVYPYYDDICEHEETYTIYAQWSGATSPYLSTYGGSRAHWKGLETDFKYLMSLRETDRFSGQCYWQELSNKLPGEAGDNLRELTQSGGDFFGSTYCPPGLSVISGGEACDFPTDAQVDQAISAAASKYNVPPSLLRAIFEIESGVWINSPESYVCEENNPTAKAVGVMQITSSTYNVVTCENERFSDDIGICDTPGNKLSRCDVNDAFELAARVLLWKVDKWVYGPGNCYATGGISASNIQEIYTAACGYYGSSNPDTYTINYSQQIPAHLRRPGGDMSYCDIVCYKMGLCPPYPAR